MLSADEAAQLIEAIASRQDRAAFESLFRHFAPRVKAFIMRGGTDAEAAQEVAQEALIMVWRKAASFDRSRASAATWIYTIARNKRIDLLRRAQRPIDAEDWLVVYAPEDEDADKSVLAGQTYTRVKELMGGLSADQLASSGHAWIIAASGENSSNFTHPCGGIWPLSSRVLPPRTPAIFCKPWRGTCWVPRHD